MACARQCGVDKLMDDRFRGVAEGVGSARLLGRIHHVNIHLGTDVEPVVIACAVSVIDHPNLQLLLGLDMLRRHRCVVDLDRDVLMVGGISGSIVSFAT